MIFKKCTEILNMMPFKYPNHSLNDEIYFLKAWLGIHHTILVQPVPVDVRFQEVLLDFPEVGLRLRRVVGGDGAAEQKDEYRSGFFHEGISSMLPLIIVGPCPTSIPRSDCRPETTEK